MTIPNQLTAVPLVALAILSVVAAPVTYAEETSVKDIPVSIERDTYEQHTGDVFEMNLTFDNDNATFAYVAVGSDDDPYGAVVNVTDGDEDGRVTLGLNTFYAMQNRRTAGFSLYPRDGTDDDVDVVSVLAPENESAEPIPPGNYTMTVGTDYNESSGEVENVTDEATLSVIERGPTSATIMTVPRDALSFDTPEELTERYDGAAFASLATETDRIAKGDYAVVRLDVSGVYGYVRRRIDLTGVGPGQKPTGVYVDFEQQYPQTTDPMSVNLEALYNALVVDEENDRMYLVTPTESDEFVADGVYRFTFEVNESNRLVADTSSDIESERARTSFTVDERRATVQTPAGGSRLVTGDDPNVEVSGTTTLAFESDLVVEVTGTNEDETFQANATTTAGANGTFATTVDLSAFPNNTSVTVNVTDGDDVLGSTEGTVVTDEQTTPTPGENVRTTVDGETTDTTTTAEVTTTARATTTDDDAQTRPTTTETDDDEAAQPTPGLGVVLAIVALMIATTVAAVRTRR
jgi:hypothetical protein